MTQSRGRKRPTYRATPVHNGKSCTKCGLKVTTGQLIQFTKDGISRNHPVPRHVRCPQYPVTVRYVEVT